MSVVSLEGAVVTSGSYPLLAGLDLEIEPHTLTVATGANGAGKTSLLRLLGGLVPLSAGVGRVCGVDLVSGDRRDLRRRVGWLGHQGSFYDDLTVRENLGFAARALARPRSAIEPALERVGLSSRSATTTRLLSAGQRRRLGLAWLLVRRAELWLLDEPYASLDGDGRDFLDGLLGEVTAAGATVVISAHDRLRSPTLVARTVVLVGGRVAGDRAGGSE